jgi:hypothetical protein
VEPESFNGPMFQLAAEKLRAADHDSPWSAPAVWE